MVRVPPTCPRRSAATNRRRSHLRPGFTLVETLVTLTIVGLAIGLSIPGLTKMATQARVQRAAQTLQGEVQQAFAIAGRNRVPVKLTWSSSALQLRVTNLAGTTVFRRRGVGQGGGFGLSASDVTVIPATLTVFPSGLASDTLVIAVKKSGFSRTVRVSRSGMVRSR